MKIDLWIQFGCGLCAPDSWVNYDSSPSLLLQRLPVVGRLVPSGPYGRFPPNVVFGDIVKGLPIPDGAASLLYCSHVLEHLSLEDLRTALRNCRRVLALGGIFRLVLPDVEFMVNEYNRDPAPEAAIRLMENTILGKKTRPRGIRGFTREWLGNSQHLWMWDYKSLSMELANAGFTGIRRAEFGDSQVTAFHAVESPDRWKDALGIECR
jgi:SAM-dependent methyltransferase